MFKLKVIIISFLLIFSHTTSAKPADKLRIAAGSLLEGYYSIGLKLCRFITSSNKDVKCEVVPTTGTLQNIELLKAQKVDFAFAQSNFALSAYNGEGYFAGKKPFKDIYQLLRLHDEVFTVIVKDDDKILVFGDLDSKNISNGPPSSDSSVTYSKLASLYNFKQAPVDIELSHEDYAKEFCRGNIDAIMMMTGHPNALVNHITHSCESDFVTIDSQKIDLLLKTNPAFHKVILPAGRYPGITAPQETVAAPAIFVAHKSVDAKILTNFMNYFQNKKKSFKLSHPVLYDLDEGHFMSNFILPGFNINNKQE